MSISAEDFTTFDDDNFINGLDEKVSERVWDILNRLTASVYDTGYSEGYAEGHEDGYAEAKEGRGD